MTRISASLLSVLAAALWPAQGQAQAGPSFNCADSDTATESAICANPELSQLELQMFASYLRLVDAVGERRARNIADRFLERRQACGADEACIAERLAISMRVFERRAGGNTELAASEPSEEELTGRQAPAEEVATIEAPATQAPAIESPVEEEVVVLPTPPARPERFAFLEPDPEPFALEEEPALAEPAPLVEEEVALAPAPLVEDDGALAPEPVPLVEEDVPLAPEPAPLADSDLALAEPVSPVEEPLLAEPASPIEELAPDDEDVAAFEPPEAFLPEEEVASAESVEPDLPLAAQAPLPDDLDPLLENEPSDSVDEAPADVASAEPILSAEEQPVPDDLDPLLEEEPSDSVDEAPADVASAEPIPSAEEQSVLSAEEMSGAIDGAELASSDETAPFDLPVSWAFMELSRDQRAEVQARLQATGFYEGPADGAWDQATLAGLQAFFASEEGAGFETSTLTGAGLALDFIRSDAYGEAHGLPALADEAVPDPNDPLASTDW